MPMKQLKAIDTIRPLISPPANDSRGQRLLDEACARVGRLEAVLAATGGTLHDVNNLLTVLSGNLYLLTEAVRDNPALLARCRTARNTAQRAGELIHELLNFARDREQSTDLICPARHVQSMDPLLRRGIDAVHRFKIKSDEEPWFVAASAAQFESAVANLVINAHEAMSSPGAIEVRVRNTSLNNVRCGAGLEIHGDFVCVSVSDNGSGIPADLLRRVADPLFTSKPRGQGNGMGLSMVKAFAVRAGGNFTIESEEGKGTTARIWLPRKSRSGDSTASLTMPISTLPAGDETVLLVTADSAARATMTQLLDALGYTVLQSGNRKNALNLARNNEGISLLICERTDKLHAEERRWLEEVRKYAPEARQVALLDPDADAQEVAAEADACVRLPIAVPDLARSIRSALEKQK